jgi:16S rRNA (uracil1498-N3)-methyltransferase
MQLFYAPGIGDNKKYTLSNEESTHCIGVLRYRIGQPILLTDGSGYFYDAIISDISRKQVTVTVSDKKHIGNDRLYWLHMAVAPTKNIERFEWFIEKATEIGIDEITPITTENSERKHLRIDRLEKIAVAAMKQSVKSSLPKINPLIKYVEFINRMPLACQKYLAHCGSGSRELLQKIYLPGKNAIILIGPEGDFAPLEIELGLKKGLIPISLGNSKLRTETAGVTACHTIFLLNQK